MNVAVILAGGVGSRLGAGIPKQFIKILGKPILAYSIEPFEKHPLIDVILVVCVKSHIDYIDEIKKKYGFKKLIWVTQGGDTFQGSVLNGVKFLADKLTREDTVLFHFGASPLIKPEIITDVINVCKKTGTNAISTTDFLLLSGKKKKETSVSDPENYTDEYINRDTIAVMNTPHAFQYGYISDIYKQAIKTGIINTVEPHTTTLMYAMGEKIHFAKGSQDNIKITTKEDLEFFEGYVLEQERKNKEITSGDIVVFLADGFEECEGLIVADILRRAGIKVIMASIMGRRDVISSRNILIHADCLAENVNYNSAKFIVLPGGRKGTENLSNNIIVKEQCIRFAKQKHIAAICAAPTILADLGLLSGKRSTVHPDFKSSMKNAVVLDEPVVTDGNIITGQGLGSTFDFAFEIIRSMGIEEKAKSIKASICYND